MTLKPTLKGRPATKGAGGADAKSSQQAVTLGSRCEVERRKLNAQPPLPLPWLLTDAVRVDIAHVEPPWA